MNEPTPDVILNTIDKNEKDFKKRQLNLPANLNNALMILAGDMPGMETNELIIDVLTRYVKRPENQERIARLTRVEL